MTPLGWVKADALTIGGMLALRSMVQTEPTASPLMEECRLAGYFAGLGHRFAFAVPCGLTHPEGLPRSRPAQRLRPGGHVSHFALETHDLELLGLHLAVAGSRRPENMPHQGHSMSDEPGPSCHVTAIIEKGVIKRIIKIEKMR